jgi:hypothetical protein
MMSVIIKLSNTVRPLGIYCVLLKLLVIESIFSSKSKVLAYAKAKEDMPIR